MGFRTDPWGTPWNSGTHLDLDYLGTDQEVLWFWRECQKFNNFKVRILPTHPIAATQLEFSLTVVDGMIFLQIIIWIKIRCLNWSENNNNNNIILPSRTFIPLLSQRPLNTFFISFTALPNPLSSLLFTWNFRIWGPTVGGPDISRNWDYYFLWGIQE